MSEKVGYNDGLLGLVGWVRKVSLGTVKFRPLAERPASLSQWFWLEKLERTLRILKDSHDASVPGPAPAPTPTPTPAPPPPASFVRVAPRVAYEQDGSNARFLLYVNGGGLQPGVSRRPDGKYTDESRAVYTDLDGREESAVRSPGPAVTGAREMDNRPLHDLPLMGDPTRNTGSWAI